MLSFFVNQILRLVRPWSSPLPPQRWGFATLIRIAMGQGRYQTLSAGLVAMTRSARRWAAGVSETP